MNLFETITWLAPTTSQTPGSRSVSERFIIDSALPSFSLKKNHFLLKAALFLINLGGMGNKAAHQVACPYHRSKLTITSLALLITWAGFELRGSSLAHADCIPTAFTQVAHEYDVPADVYYAIALQESGRYTQDYGFKVWPWALNINYTTHYPQSYEDAVALIDQTLDEGSEWIAVGMMQVYWKYHKARFDENPYYALDIATNLRLGAQIFAEALDYHGGDAFKAVGHYYAGVITSERERLETQIYINGVKSKLNKYVRGGCDDEVQLVQHP